QADPGGHPHRPRPGLHGQPRSTARRRGPGRGDHAMRNWLRGKRRGLVTFMIICGLVAGGLGWATSAALRLEGEQHEGRLRAEQEQARQAFLRERAQQEAELQEKFAAKLRLALWRLDSRIAPVLARE